MAEIRRENPPGMVLKPLSKIMGKNYQPQLVNAGFLPLKTGMTNEQKQPFLKMYLLLNIVIFQPAILGFGGGGCMLFYISFVNL